MARSEVGEEVDQDFAFGRVQFDLVGVLGEIDGWQDGVDFGFAVLGHGVGLLTLGGWWSVFLMDCSQ
jgi:hypothetical protein